MKKTKIFGTVLVGVLFALPVLVQAQLTFFPIATNGAAISFAFDGTNYLVGVENHQTPSPTIGAQLISTSGAKVGALIDTGRSGIASAVAFDGTNYLLIWEDNGLGTLTNGSYQVYGQFISPAGATVGSPFNISGLGIWFDGVKPMAFGGGKYLVTYTRLINPALGDDSTNRYIAGRLVNPNGTMDPEFRISPGYGAASDVAYDGTAFFMVWREDQFDTEIRGRFGIPYGNKLLMGDAISVNASAAPSDNPESVTFDGTNYLVVWNDEVGGPGSGEWDCFGQLVDINGDLVGSAFTITDEPGPQMVTSVAFDGSNYMAVWMDMQNETNWDMYGQYIDTAGSLVDGKFAISTNALNQLGGVGFANGKYLVLVNNGVEKGEGGISQVDSATGAFIVPPTTPTELFFSDDFNDNTKDAARWGDDLLVDQGTNAILTETNGRLEFTGISAEALSVGVVRPWIGSFASYTQNWEAAVDVNVGAFSLPQNFNISMFLAVIDPGDPEIVDHFSMELYQRNDFDTSTRRYSVNGAFNNNEVDLGMTTTADQQSRLRLAFDASTKVLTASFNGNALGSMDVDDVATSWGMADGSNFLIVLGGSLWGDGVTNSGHEIYADNFELRTGDELEYILTVNNGSGSGNYTNGVGIAITAATAPAGQVFDHWVGSTQYLANAASATTTVTMPAQAITITAAYKLIGTGSGDDFNDNVKDTGKWEDDFNFMGTNATLHEINGRLEFLKQSGVDAQGVLRPWTGSVGSYTQNWEVAVDASLAQLALPSPGTWINLNLVVINRGDTNAVYGSPFRDGMAIALDLYSSDNKVSRGYEMTAQVDENKLTGFPSKAYASTSDMQGRLKIAFDASTKVLTASYNGNILGWVDVDDPGSDWNMADGDTFGFGLVGSCSTEALDVASGEAYFDNFAVTGTVDPPEDGNGNGLPDWWEKLYYSGPVLNPNALCANGFNTILEAYIAGLDPTDPNGWFGITGFNGNMIQWDAITGRVYSVYWSTNLMAGFQTLETNYTGGVFTDTLHSAAKKCFYKIDVRLAP